MIYFASPIGSAQHTKTWKESKERLTRNEAMVKKLKQAGFNIYLPQANQAQDITRTLEEQLSVIRNCEFLILVLSDTRGMYIEAGYAKAFNKKIYALEVEETRKYSGWLVAFCDYIAKDIDDLIGFIKQNN